MQIRWLFFLILLFFSSAQANSVRVLLTEEGEPLQIAFQGASEISTPTQKISIYDSKYSLQFERQKTDWILIFFRGTKKEKFRLRGEALVISSLAPMIWKEQMLDFRLQITKDEQKNLLIGEMTMERYLSGVVEHEMPSSWPLEALKAQAVASRSYAFWKIKNNKNHKYDLRPSVLDQVFQLPRQGEAKSLPPKVEKALMETQGEVLVSPQQKVIKAYFHADCGGETISAQEAWGEQGASGGSVQDPYCQSRNSEWSSLWNEQQIQQRLMREFVLPFPMQLKNIIVRREKLSQRAESVDFIFKNGVFKRVRAETVRRLMGYDKIRSTSFQIQAKNFGWEFLGRGFGHGVGLCQHGSRAMAASGAKYQTILKHYYPDTKILSIDRNVLLSAMLDD